MIQAVPVTHIEAHIQGDIKGQVAIGNNILQIGSVHGGVVNIAMPGQVIPPRPRSSPVLLRPRPFPGILDRQTEVAGAVNALRSTQPAEFYARSGMGKTTLLRHLAYYPLDASFPDGVIYLPVRQQPVMDLLQFLFDAFYESDTAVKSKPDDAQVRHALQGKQALVLLDDADLSRDDLQTLMNAAPNCTFLLASAERRLWGEGHAVALPGLPIQDAEALIEREMGRPLTAAEQPAAQALATAMHGHPLSILQAVALARNEGLTLSEVARRLQSDDPDRALAAAILASLPEPERRVVLSLAAFGGIPLDVEHVAALAGLPDIKPIMEKLLSRGLLHSHASRYRLTGALNQALYAQAADEVTDRAIAYFTRWVETQRRTPGRIGEDAETILHTLQQAVQTGRWKEVLRLVVNTEGALALSGHWGAWEQTLQAGLQAAKAMRSRPAEAWLAHQSGTRALCLGNAAAARTHLIQALRLREASKDRVGASVTRHNLNILLEMPAPSQKPPSSPPKPPAPGISLFSNGLFAVILAALLTLGGLGILRPILNQEATSSATVTPVNPPHTPVPSETPTPTLTPIATATDMPTPAPSGTTIDTPTDAPIFVPTETPCSRPFGWPIYIVRRGDTLSSIGRATGALPQQLMQANCLTGDWIYAGQPLLVPHLPIPPTDTPTPEPTLLPMMEIKPQEVYFDNQIVGTRSTPQAVTLTSVGTEGVAISGVSLFGGNASDFAVLGDTCSGALLSPGASCSISVSFVPSGAGNRNAILSVDSNAQGARNQVVLAGIGVDPPTPPKVDLSADRTVIVKGECLNLRWQIELDKVKDAYLTGGEFKHLDISSASGVQDACPAVPTAYTLHAILYDGGELTRSVEISVELPSPVVEFWADNTELPSGECTGIHWQASNVGAVYYQKAQAHFSGNVTECFDAGVYTLELRVIAYDESEYTYTITITVYPPG